MYKNNIIYRIINAMYIIAVSSSITFHTIAILGWFIEKENTFGKTFDGKIFIAYSIFFLICQSLFYAVKKLLVYIAFGNS